MEYQLLLEPTVLTDGKPTSNGTSCREKQSGLGVAGGHEARPDFLFSQAIPRRLQPSGPKSYIIGDIKYDASYAVRDMRAAGTPGNSGKQWKALINHARSYSYSRTVLYLSFWGLTSSESRELRKAAFRERTFVVLLSVRGGSKK